MITQGDDIMKKILCVFSIIVLSLTLVGCGEKLENKNIEGSLEEIMAKLYEGIKEDELPMALKNVPLNEENFKYYAFADIKYEEAIASESMTGSIAHSVVLIRLQDGEDASNAIKEIKENADPRKWICVEAENVYVLNQGDLIVLIMSNDLAEPIKTNFENLK